MRLLVETPRFRRSYRRFVRHNASLQKRIEESLRQMEIDVFAPQMGAHKLSGELLGLFACSCGYDCRIVFTIEVGESDAEEVILLLDIGSHDDVY